MLTIILVFLAAFITTWGTSSLVKGSEIDGEVVDSRQVIGAALMMAISVTIVFAALGGIGLLFGINVFI